MGFEPTERVIEIRARLGIDWKNGNEPGLMNMLSGANRAPARYPAKFAAPRYTAEETLYQWAAIKAGISGV